MILSIQNILLLVVSAVSLIISILVFSRGVRNNKINLYFSIFTFFGFLWAICEFLARILTSDVWMFFNRVTYFSPLVIAVSFYYFSIYFPYVAKKPNRIISILILIPLVFFSFIVFNDKWFMTGGTKDLALTEYTVIVNQGMYTAYAIFFSVVVLIALYNLFIKYLNAELVWKQSIRAILIAILIAFILGSYLDLILPYYSNFHYFWLAPIFTFLINYVVFRIIYGKSNK